MIIGLLHDNDLSHGFCLHRENTVYLHAVVTWINIVLVWRSHTEFASFQSIAFSYSSAIIISTNVFLGMKTRCYFCGISAKFDIEKSL